MKYICDNCEQEFKRYPSQVRGKSKYCSRSCYCKNNENNPNFHHNITEKEIRKLYPNMNIKNISNYFGVDRGTIERRLKLLNIKIIINRKQNKNGNWKGGKKKVNCEFCNKEIYRYPNQIGKHIYCSGRCSMISIRNSGKFSIKPNGIELKIIEICNKYTFPFKFVGDGSFIIGKLNPDFIDITSNKVIEVFGDYWHKNKLKKTNCLYTERERREYFKKYGYNLLVIWEHEIKNNLDKVINKIREYSNLSTEMLMKDKIKND